MENLLKKCLTELVHNEITIRFPINFGQFMKICIGGDLDGQKVEKDVYSFKTTEILPERK